MQNRRRSSALFVVATLAAGSFGITGCSSSSSPSSAGQQYQLARNAEGGNAPQTYNYVRTDTGAPRAAEGPYALAGRSDRPTGYVAVTNTGGNGRVINLVPRAD